MSIELANWFLSHQDLVAWTLGWGAALCVTQAAKLYIAPHVDPGTVKKILHGIAVVSGGALAFMLWPDKINEVPVSLMHKIGFAVTAGLSAPAAYTLGKAFLEWQFPAFAEKLSWDNLKR